jgi:Ca2+-transporting ATPase
MTTPQSNNDIASDAHRLPCEEVVRRLASDLTSGLGESDAAERLARVGPNELASKPRTPSWRKFLAQFRDPLVLLLLAATAISIASWLYERDTGWPYEATAILAIVMLNAVLGHVQQARAEQALAALRRMSAAQANVIRAGVRQRIEAARVVPGDLVVIEEGDTIPADARLVNVSGLQTAEASLTGESIPVDKEVDAAPAEAGPGDQLDMIFAGTSVTSGHGLAVVTATGMHTQMGRIAGMLAGAPAESTPLQRDLARVGRLLGVIVIAIAAVMILILFLVEEVRGVAAVLDVLIFGVALAVAAVPEGLPVVVAAVLALGVQRMAKRKAIVRHLAAVETLGSASVIASDKTGTLTRNEMTVRAIVTATGRANFGGTGYAPEGAVTSVTAEGVEQPLTTAQRTELEHALAVGDRANNATLHQQDDRWHIQGDPTEAALIVAARKAGSGSLESRFERVAEVPFSSERKLMSTVDTDAERHGRLRVFTKGAADVLLARCTHELVGAESRALTEDRRARIRHANDALAGEALRTLGVAFRTLPADAMQGSRDGPALEHELVFAGLVGMLDPPRVEAKQAVARARAAGIRPMMITGDHPVTAAVIAAELGIGDGEPAVTGAELAPLSDEELRGVVRTSSIYARVDPGHKLRIVQALQANGDMVAMTGDGVNDAPALQTADIGVAMGITGTDVSRQASDIVLQDDNFATIVAAVEEGRAIFANIRKFLRYLLSSNMGEVLTMFGGVLLADAIGLTGAAPGAVALPLLAVQVLWINLVTDGAPALALGIDPPDAGNMRRRPRPRAEGVLTARMWRGILFVGIVTAMGTLLSLDASLPGGFIEGSGSLQYGQTVVFTTLVFFSLFTVFNARSDNASAFVGLFDNPWLWASVSMSLLLQVAVVHAPFLQQAFSTTALSIEDWLRCLAVGSSVLWLNELRKLIGRQWRSRFFSPKASG